VAPFRILSLDGGGAKGVYTLGVLKGVEAAFDRPLCEVFDLIYGTSTGAIIAALIALGYRIDEIEKLYFALIPRIMNKWFSHGRMEALKREANEIFGSMDFSAFKIPIGIVCANHAFERPMVFKNLREQAHGRKATFEPGFGCTIAEAIIGSSAAYPFFRMFPVSTSNQGDQLLMDGGYVANNPSLFALADAHEAFDIAPERIGMLSVGVGSYDEPERSILHRLIFSLWPFRHMAKMFNISSKTVEQLQAILFPDIACVRVNEAYPQKQYATDLLEADPKKLKTLFSLGGESFGKFEASIRTTLKI